MADIKRWTILSLLSPEFVDNIQSAVVFGSSGSDALIITDDDEVFGFGTNFCSCLGSLSHGSLEVSKLETMSKRKIKQISFGSGPHVLALSEDGIVYSWGHNAFGQLGLGHTLQGTSPMTVQGALVGERVVEVCCGGHHSVSLTERGDIFTWGLNSSGQLGIGSVVNQDTPRQVLLHNRCVRAIACGHNTTLALTESGDVYGFGSNQYGQIGTGNASNQHSPFFIEALSKTAVIKRIACGYAHSMALSDEGNLYVWGSNSCGQLGGNLLRKNLTEPVQTAKEIGRISEIAAAHLCNITVAANKEGKVYMWGHIRGQSISSPICTRFNSLDDVFASFASPPVSHRMLFFDKKRKLSILDDIRLAFDDPTTSDLQIVVDGYKIHAHKALLKMRCQYFRSRLGEQWSEGASNEMLVKEFSYPIYRSFLHWLYTDELNIDPDDAMGLLELANCYCEMALKSRCAAIIERGISISNAAALFQMAIKFEIDTLEQTCFQFCLNHMSAVVQTDAFQRLDEQTIKQLISRAAKEGIFKR